MFVSPFARRAALGCQPHFDPEITATCHVRTADVNMAKEGAVAAQGRSSHRFGCFYSQPTMKGG
ncbi:MAG TPA: hypothetical protein VLH56_07210 [Dissulfurispiraceae bacterium]|nr:hypothetical protein [Dissulfurispiraceae bacterium]